MGAKPLNFHRHAFGGETAARRYFRQQLFNFRIAKFLRRAAEAADREAGAMAVAASVLGMATGDIGVLRLQSVRQTLGDQLFERAIDGRRSQPRLASQRVDDVIGRKRLRRRRQQVADAGLHFIQTRGGTRGHFKLLTDVIIYALLP